MSRLCIVVAAACGLIGLPFACYTQHHDDAMYDFNASVLMTHASDEEAGGLVQAYALSKKPVAPHQIVAYTNSMLRGFPSILMGTANIRETALHIATQGNNEEFFKLMLSARCSKKSHQSKNCHVCINDEHNGTIGTPLHGAVQRGDYEKARKLLGAGMRIDMKVNGDTPLDVAAAQGDIKMMELLKDRKARLSPDKAQQLIVQDIPNKMDVIELLDGWQAFGLVCSETRHSISLANATLTGDVDLQLMFTDASEWSESKYKLRCGDLVMKLQKELSEKRVDTILKCRNIDIVDAVIATKQSARDLIDAAGGERALFELIIKENNIALMERINKVSLSCIQKDNRKGILKDEIVDLITQAASQKNRVRLNFFKAVLSQRGCNSGLSALSHLIANHDSQGVAILEEFGVSLDDLSLEEKKWIAPRLKQTLAQQSMMKICSYIAHYCAGCAANGIALVRGVDAQPLTTPSILCTTGTREQEMSLINIEREILFQVCGDKGLHFMNARFAACYNNTTLEPVSFLESIDYRSPELIDCGMSVPGCPSLLHVIASLGHVGLINYILDRPGKLNKKGKHACVNSCAGPDAQTPLHMATSAVAAVRLLVNAGADESIRDTKGRTPLVLAMERKHENTVRFLLNSVESQKALDNAHYNMLAELNLCWNIAGVLLDKGLFKGTVNGWTAQELAVLGNNNELVGLFMPKEYGARRTAYKRVCKSIANKLGFDYQLNKTHQHQDGHDEHTDVTILRGAQNALHYLACCKNRKLLPKITAENNLKAWMEEYQASFTDLLGKCLSVGNNNLLYGMALIQWKDEQMRDAYRDALAHVFLTCSPENIAFLVKAKCDINARGNGQSALRMAYCMQDAERITALEENGACLTDSERRELWPICELHLRDGIVKRFNRSLKRALGVSH